MVDNTKKLKQTSKQKAFQQEEARIDLSELFFRLLEKLWFIVLCAVIGLGISVAVRLVDSTPYYEATSKVYVLNSSDSVINLSDLQLGNVLAADYMEIFNIWEVNQEVVDNLNLPYSRDQVASMLYVWRPADTRIICISVYSSNPEEAALIANEYANVFREYVAKTMNTDKPQIMSRALVPTVPYNTKGIGSLLRDLLIGAAVGIILVVIQFLTDDKLKTAEDIQRATGLTVLASIPVEDAKANYTMDEEKGREQKK